DPRILVTGEPDVADLAGLARVEERAVRAFLVENAVRILVAQNLVMLNEIDMVGLQALQRFVELLGGGRLRSTVDLGHEKRLLPVSVAERLAHARLARALVVVPAVVEKIDPAIDRLPNDLDRELLGDVFQTE